VLAHLVGRLLKVRHQLQVARLRAQLAEEKHGAAARAKHAQQARVEVEENIGGGLMN